MKNFNIQGKINSIESLGTLDGPGVRCVVFFQGCGLRCKYCHNPEMWNLNGGRGVSSGELLNEVKRLKPYFGKEGGVTLSGGEPLAQLDFLLEFVRECKNSGINVALDTSGCLLNEKVKEILNYVDIVILDIKYWDEKKYHELTGGKLDDTLKFLDYVNGKKRIWIRQVIFPWTGEKDIEKLAGLLRGKKVERVELLGFHNMAKDKWKKLSLDYEFGDVAGVGVERLKNLQEYLDEKMV